MTKSLAILEHPDHLSLLKENIPPDTLVIGVTSYAAYELERQGVNFKIPDDYYDHQKFFGDYQECTSRLFDSIIDLDEKLWKIDPRFKDLNVKPFFLGTYQFKFPFDAIQIYIHFFNRILQKELPQEVTIVSDRGIKSSTADELNFYPTDAVCREVLVKFSRAFGFKLNIINPSAAFLPHRMVRNIKKNIWFKKLKVLKNHFKEKTKTDHLPMNSNIRVLSVDCRDLNVLASSLSSYGYIIDRFTQYPFAFISSANPYMYTQKILQSIDADGDLQKLYSYENIDFYDLMREKIHTFIKSLNNYLCRYQWLEQFLTKGRYDMVVLNSLSSHDLESVMMADICQKRGIPHVCWMHGGYGANQTFEGYDVTDLMLADYYFTYGDAINRAIEEYFPEPILGQFNWQKIEAHYPKRPVQCLTMGSPWMEEQNSDISTPCNEKKKILFIMGELWVHNQYYMGGNSPYTYSQKWNQIKAILQTLITYQNRYEIIIKTYPSDQEGYELLQRFLKDHGGNIRVIKDEQSIQDLIFQSDVTVSTWVSTTFFQVAFTDCDQFLFDNSDLTPEAKKILSENFFFSSQIKEFCDLLRDYLGRGMFYQKTKEGFRREYLDQNHKQDRIERIDKCFQTIFKKTQSCVL